MSRRGDPPNPLLTVLAWGALAVAGLAALLYGAAALFVVPAPSERTATLVSGLLASIGRPHPEYGDLSISLESGRCYYINRANEIEGFDWERLLEEVQPGDAVTLTVVRPLLWRLFPDLGGGACDPVAGVRTARTVYLDLGRRASR